jgi:hypothetical protein
MPQVSKGRADTPLCPRRSPKKALYGVQTTLGRLITWRPYVNDP